MRGDKVIRIILNRCINRLSRFYIGRSSRRSPIGRGKRLKIVQVRVRVPPSAPKFYEHDGNQ